MAGHMRFCPISHDKLIEGYTDEHFSRRRIHEKKELARQMIMHFLSNPENGFPARRDLSIHRTYASNYYSALNS